MIVWRDENGIGHRKRNHNPGSNSESPEAVLFWPYVPMKPLWLRLEDCWQRLLSRPEVQQSDPPKISPDPAYTASSENYQDRGLCVVWPVSF